MFGPELPGLDRDAIRDWYNGYRWLGEEVYNPFDILSLFRRRKFGAYWFETGTPAFLLDTLFRRRVSSVELDGMVGSGDLLSAFDMDDWRPRRSSSRRDTQSCPTTNEPGRGAGFQRETSPKRGAKRSLEDDRDTSHRTDTHSRPDPGLPGR